MRGLSASSPTPLPETPASDKLQLSWAPTHARTHTHTHTHTRNGACLWNPITRRQLEIPPTLVNSTTMSETIPAHQPWKAYDRHTPTVIRKPSYQILYLAQKCSLPEVFPAPSWGTGEPTSGLAEHVALGRGSGCLGLSMSMSNLPEVGRALENSLGCQCQAQKALRAVKRERWGLEPRS